MDLLKDHSLQPYNTFGIDVRARFFTDIAQVEDLVALRALPDYGQLPKLVLGGGSNLLFTKDYEGLVLKVGLMGKTVVQEDAQSVLLKLGSGENWHEVVLHCVQNGWSGVENLSLIPGNIGAAPIQNIGAYGVELKEVFYELEALHLETGELMRFRKEECRFGYRDSIFKQELKSKTLITSVTLRLSKQAEFKTTYGAIERELEAMQVSELSIDSISQAVINIRQSKLPDPSKIGNAGSFFKNPIIPTSHFEALKESFPEIVGYRVSDQETKVAAGWLIEKAGWKGRTFDQFGVHKKQALVLVNYGHANGKSIYDLSSDILESIQNTFGIALEREVNIL